MNGESGKGDTYRPVNKEAYDRGYLRVFGIPCPHCNLKKLENGKPRCVVCNGVGWIEKNRSIK
jgi:hypothetical protein